MSLFYYQPAAFFHIIKCTADPAELRSTQQSGVILLTKCILDMPSYTYAVKAQRLLRARGCPCTIKRREKSSGYGCGFSVIADESCQSAADVLDMYDIPYSLRNGGGKEDDKL